MILIRVDVDFLDSIASGNVLFVAAERLQEIAIQELFSGCHKAYQVDLYLGALLFLPKEFT